MRVNLMGTVSFSSFIDVLNNNICCAESLNADEFCQSDVDVLRGAANVIESLLNEQKKKVAACNCHDALVEALKMLIGFIPDGWPMPLGYSQVVAQAETALAKAEGVKE